MKTSYKQDYWKKRFVFYHFINLSRFQIESLRLAHVKAGNRGITFLDLGCGDGRYLFAYYSEERLHPQDTTIALDVSYDALVTTKQAVHKTIPVQGDALQLPFKKNAFDLVQCSMLIEHVSDVMLLREIKYILPPGAVLYLITVIRRPYAPFRTRSPEGRLVLAMNHLREYKNTQEIIDLVTNNGFTSYGFRSYVLKISPVRRLIMQGLKWRLIDLPIEKRTFVIDPKMKKIIKLLSFPIPIIGYYVFEGIFIADGE